MSIFGGRKQTATSDDSYAPGEVSTSRQVAGFETVLGPSSSLHGSLRCQANVRLDGAFEGTLEIDGNVLVGETARITADIHAKNVSIAGAVRGNVSGKKVQLLRTGRVWGDISAAAIATEEGAFIEGKITMVSHEAAQSIDPAALPPPSLEADTAPADAASSNLAGSREDAPEGAEQLPADDNGSPSTPPGTDSLTDPDA